MVRGRDGEADRAADVRDALRLAFGTLTVLPVRPPAQVDRRTAGRAMVLAPLVGLVLAGPVTAVLWLLGSATVRPAGVPSLLGAALVLGLLALLTRGLHLDGLADTADGLGSGREADEALSVMRRSDVGPFGTATLVLVLLVQVTALGSVLAREHGVAALGAALVLSRLAIPLMCLHGIPAARRDGLGHAVVGSVSRLGLLAAAALALGGVAVCLLLTGVTALGPGDRLAPVAAVAAAVLPLVVTALFVRRCVHRFGGVSGDVLGAGVEVAFTSSLLVLALG